MSSRITDVSVFHQSADRLAQELLGKIICRKMKEDGFVMRCRIIETEAYFVGDEPFCYGGKSKNLRNIDTMFYSVGNLCAYADMLMISCTNENTSDNVLIRGVDCYPCPTNVIEALDIESGMNAELCASDTVWLQDDGVQVEFIASKRVNIPDDALRNFKVSKITY